MKQDYLVISRGQWDADASKTEIETAIAQFYDWLHGCIAQGRMKMGSRLNIEGAVASKGGVVTDGPFGEGKEIVGGYWFIVAESLREAAELAAQNPCAQFGLTYEVRPLEAERASVFHLTNETKHLPPSA
jgi:hypothetical protein